MIKLQVSQKDLKLSVILLSLIILGLTYQFVYLKNVDKTEVLQKDINNLQIRLADEKAKYISKDKMKKENETMIRQIISMINSYGDGPSEEKSLMFIKSLEGVADISINSVTFAEPELFLTATKPQIASENNSKQENAVNTDDMDLGSMVGYKTTTTIAFQVSYAGLKKCLDYINQYPQKCRVGEVTVSFDSETGNLTGTMDILMYHLQGVGRTYSDPVIPNVTIGTDNIFKTIELPAK